MEYNTTREGLSMKEYGRHIQKMVDYLVTIADKEKRQEQAEILIELMGFLNPHLKNVEDFRHKLWDHLFYMSDFKLVVDSPYPIPTKEEYNEKPEPLPYPNHKPKYAHLGKNLEILIQKAKEETDLDKKKALTNTIAYYIKLAYSNWHKESVSDEAITAELNHLSNGELNMDSLPKFKFKPTIEPERTSSYGAKRSGFTNRNNNNNGNNRSNNNNRTNNNNRSNNNNNNRKNNNRPGGGFGNGSSNNNFKKRFK